MYAYSVGLQYNSINFSQISYNNFINNLFRAYNEIKKTDVKNKS